MKLLIIGVAVALGSLRAGGDLIVVESTFDTDAEGWQVVELNLGAATTDPPVITDRTAPSHTTAGGNPGGYIALVNTGLWSYFEAPPKFLGDQADAFGGHLWFDMAVDGAPTLRGPTVVILVGAGRTLYGDLQAVPGPAFTPLVIALAPSAAWRLNSVTGPVPSHAEMRSALANLDSMYLTMEWVTAYFETVRLDNVRLSIPEPAALGLVALGGLGLLRRKRGAGGAPASR